MACNSTQIQQSITKVPSWRRLGGVLGRLGGILEASWGGLGVSWGRPGSVQVSQSRGAQLEKAGRVTAIKMIAKTRFFRSVARPFLCKKNPLKIIVFHWFFKLFSYQDDRKNSPNINPPAVVARSRLATIPPPDLPLGCKFILRSHPDHNVPRAIKIAKALPVIRQPSREVRRGTTPPPDLPLSKDIYPAEPP